MTQKTYIVKRSHGSYKTGDERTERPQDIAHLVPRVLAEKGSADAEAFLEARAKRASEIQKKKTAKPAAKKPAPKKAATAKKRKPSTGKKPTGSARRTKPKTAAQKEAANKLRRDRYAAKKAAEQK